MQSLDTDRLLETFALAETGFGVTEPNPRVGCVIGLPDGTVLGRGATQAAGQAHAEVMALRDAQNQAHTVKGATAWVSLEPCAHFGRTPPCCDALIAAGLARVVVAVGDPFDRVAGEGIQRLRAAGIEVVMAEADLARQARDINIGFFSRMLRGRPWVRMKIAASLDGRTALPDGQSRWITGEQARADGHAWRKRASAVLTGIGTVREDNPQLDVRHVPTVLQPIRVVVDSRLETPVDAKLLQVPGRGVWIYGAQDDGSRRAALQAQGADIRLLPGDSGKVDLAAMLQQLGQRGINELHVEAGHKLNGSLLNTGRVDELLVYLAPKLLGQGREMASFGPLASLAEGLAFDFGPVQQLGPDLRILARAQASAALGWPGQA